MYTYLYRLYLQGHEGTNKRNCLWEREEGAGAKEQTLTLTEESIISFVLFLTMYTYVLPSQPIKSPVEKILATVKE